MPASVGSKHRRSGAKTGSGEKISRGEIEKMKAKIRKLATFVEETQREMDREIAPPTRKSAAVAVIKNPCAGKYVEDLSELMSIGEELGELLTQRAVQALGIQSSAAESYG